MKPLKINQVKHLDCKFSVMVESIMISLTIGISSTVTLRSNQNFKEMLLIKELLLCKVKKIKHLHNAF